MLTDASRNLRPVRDLGHYSPNTKRPNWSPNCSTSLGALASRKRFASSKKAFSFSLRAWIPCSMRSTRTRLSLRRRCFDMVSTCFAISRGRVTLRRTCFAAARFAVAILSSIYTILVQHENHMPTLLYSELQQQCRRLKPAPFRKGADRGAEAPHYPYSGSRNIVPSAPVRV